MVNSWRLRMILVACILAGTCVLFAIIDGRIKFYGHTQSGLVIRERPLKLKSFSEFRGVVNRDDLRAVLVKVQPRWAFPKVNYLLHSLRLWGTDVEFGQDPYNIYGNGTPSGQRMLSLLLNNQEAKKAGVQPVPFFYRNSYGVEAQYEAAAGGIAHHDQYLKTMGEVGLSSDTTITLIDGSTSSIHELIRTSLNKFDIEQELEFTTVAYCRWLPPQKTWFDELGNKHSFDEIAEKLLERVHKTTACYGGHTLYAMVNLIVANEIYPILEHRTSEKLRTHLINVSKQLQESQDERGFWLGEWSTSSKVVGKEDYRYQAIAVTGHHLEWIAISPPELRPKRQVIERAAVGLCKLINAQSFQTASQGYPPFSHAARALCLLEGDSPKEIFMENGNVPNK